MSLIDLHNELRGYLRGQTTIVRKIGSQINVGEEFTMRITASNVAPRDSRIYFTEVTYSVAETEYADLLTPRQDYTATVGVPFPDGRFLSPGFSISVDIQFRALRNFSDWWHDIWNAEPVAQVAVNGFLDLRRFFAAGSLVPANHEIDPT